MCYIVSKFRDSTSLTAATHIDINYGYWTTITIITTITTTSNNNNDNTI